MAISSVAEVIEVIGSFIKYEEINAAVAIEESSGDGTSVVGKVESVP
jgi:hypothetical protein